MKYDVKIQEKLKKLIFNGDTIKFKKEFNAIRITEDAAIVDQYLYGQKDEGRSLLGWAAIKSGSKELITYLIDEVGTDVNHQDSKGRTALLLACDHGCIDNVRELLLKNANPSLADFRGDTPLHIAAASGSDNTNALIELLCTAGTDVNTVNKQGATALHTAAKYNIEAIHAIIQHYGQQKVDIINKKDNDGNTPLHYSAMSETGYNAIYLLLLGANRTITNNNGETPAQTADNWDSQGVDWKAIIGFDHGGDAENFYKQIHYDELVANILEKDNISKEDIKQIALLGKQVDKHPASDTLISKIDYVISSEHSFETEELLGALRNGYIGIDEIFD